MDPATTTQPRLTTALAAQGAGAAFNAVVSFALALLLARAFGASGYGDYVALLSVALMGLIAIEGGWPTLVYRESAGATGADATRARQLAGWGVVHVAIAGALLAAVAASTRWTALPCALACMALVAAMNLVSARLRGAGEFAREALFQAVARTLSALAIALVVLAWGAHATWVFAAWAIGLLPTLAWGLPKFMPRLRELHGTAPHALAVPFLLLDGFSTLLMKSDVAWLRLSGVDGAALSYYAACTRLNEAALLACAPLANVMLRSVRVLGQDPAASRRLAGRATAFAMTAGVLATAGSALLGVPLMRLLFGVEYAPSGNLLPWTASMLIFALPNLVAVQAAIARGAERRVALVLGAGAALMIAGVWAGSRLGGPEGAAIAVAVAQACVLAALTWRGRRA